MPQKFTVFSQYFYIFLDIFIEIKLNPNNNNKWNLKSYKTAADIWKNFINFLKVFYLYHSGSYYPHF